MNIVAHIPLTIAAFWSAIFGLSLLYLAFLRLSFIVASRSEKGRRKTGWNVPTIDSNAIGKSLFHTWDVKVKLATLFTYCFIVAFLHTPWPVLAALITSGICIGLGDLPMERAIKRLSAMAGFLSMFLIVMPLTAVQHPSDPLIIIAPYQIIFNLRALQLAIVIILKAAAIALMMEPLFNTAPLSMTIDGLRRLGVPMTLCQMIMLAHRYIFVFLHEVKRMSTGMRVRGFRKKTNLETMRVLGNFIGMLMVRSVDRTERVYQAMLARGFQGTFPVYFEGQTNWHDWLKAAIFLLIGIVLLFADRIGICS